MSQALKLAQKGLGQVAPNPLVGCVIVQNNQIIGQGWHQKFGGAHAEINAITAVGKKCRGATMYVNLEPCCHHGKTPPCAEAILRAGIRQIYVAMPDPNPLVSGKGIAFLRRHGVQVETGLLQAQAQKLNEQFSHFIRFQTPFVALKIAATLDGKITRPDGERWLTGLPARRYVHHLRQTYSAILVGKNTVLQDNPTLMPYLLRGKKYQPLRIILDSRLNLPPTSHVFQTANFLIATVAGHSQAKKQLYLKHGGEILEVGKEQIDLKILLKELGKKQISSVLVEGGARVFTDFLAQNLAQKIYWFSAPLIAGAKGLNAISGLTEMLPLHNLTTRKFCNDVLYTSYL